MPAAMLSAPPKAATPTGSCTTPGLSTRKATPTSPTKPESKVRVFGRCDNKCQAGPTTNKGCTAPSVAATPPGKQQAATNNSAKNGPMFRVPRTTARHQQPQAHRQSAQRPDQQ